MNDLLKTHKELIEKSIDFALFEDVGIKDITTDNLNLQNRTAKGYMIAKDTGIIAGLPIAKQVFEKLSPKIQWLPEVKEGQKVNKGNILVRFEADYRALLVGERTALNYLQRIAGIATETAKYVETLKGTKTQILDTRKTVPGLRIFDKYAVKMGGAVNHRIGLFDMVMIKDNHIQIAGGIKAAINQIRPQIAKGIKIEVETTTPDEVQEALDNKADIIMLDNMDNETMRQCVAMISNKAQTEASGNVTLERLAEIGKIGIDFISVGALTHSVKAFDISMRLVSGQA